jgi:hypothetical protein
VAATICVAALAAVAASPATSSPQHPCKLRGYSAVKFVYGVLGSLPNARLRVRNARVICGGPDDGHWDPIGPMHIVRLSAAPTIELLPTNSVAAPKPATLAQLAQLTRLKFRDPDFGWFGDAYGVQINSAGRITSLTELFHP